MSFSADEFIRVLKACHKARVTELKIGDTVVKFELGDATQTTATKGETKVVSAGELQDAQREVLIGENLVEAENRLDLLQIDDPVRYERAIIEQELEDRGTTEISSH